MPSQRIAIIFLAGLFLIRYSFAQTMEFAAHDTACSDLSKTGLILLGSSVITFGLLETDQDTYNTIHGWKMRSSILKNVSPIVTEMGNGVFPLTVFGGFGAYGLIFQDQKTFETAKIGIESFALTGIACQVLKYTFSRERPSAATRKGGFWHGPLAYFSKSKDEGLASFDSFPSGHTTTAFAMATTFADAYSDGWVPYAAYATAGMVAISRIMESTHWLSDCFVGALLGHYGTKLTEKWNYGSASFSLLPEVKTSGCGVHFTVQF